MSPSTETADDPTIGKNTERLNELAFSFKQSQALAAALEVNLFTAISKGDGTIEGTASACGIAPETADRLLIICKAMKLVRDQGGRNVNLDDVERFLVRGRPAFSATICASRSMQSMTSGAAFRRI